MTDQKFCFLEGPLNEFVSAKDTNNLSIDCVAIANPGDNIFGSVHGGYNTQYQIALSYRSFFTGGEQVCQLEKYGPYMNWIIVCIKT